MSTKENTEIVKSKTNKELISGLDDMLTAYLLRKTVADICMERETTKNARTFVTCDLLLNAIGERDVGLINLIVKRVDGGVPKSDERKSFANLVGDAIDDVLDGPADERNNIDLQNDSGIIALAKAIVLASIEPVGKNVSKRKDRQMAAEILLNRTGGMKTEPVKETSNKIYVDPS